MLGSKILGICSKRERTIDGRRQNKTHIGIPNTKKYETTTQKYRNDIMVQKIHTKIFGNNGTLTHTITKRNRMEMGHRTRTSIREYKKTTDDRTNTGMS